MLAQLIDLRVQLARDEAMSPQQRRERDRAIGQSMDDRPPLAQVAAWLEQTIYTDHELTPGQRTMLSHRLIRLVLNVIAPILGAGSACGLLWYDGTEPVNVVWLLGFFVLFQSVVLLGTLLIASAGTNPLTHAIQWAGLGGVVAEVWQRIQRKRLARAGKDPLGDAERRAQVVLLRYGPIQKWLVLRITQAFAMNFNVGAVAAAVVMIFATDLAFGWATTVDGLAAGFPAIIETLALPWSWAWPGAVPSESLIELSRYNRADAGTWVNAADQLGGWWPFVLMSLIVYGLLPRVLTFAAVSLQTRRVLRDEILSESRTLRERMTRPLVSPAAPTWSAVPSESTRMPDTSPAAHAATHERLAVALAWAGVATPEPTSQTIAGRGGSVEQDQQAIHAAAGRAVSDDANGPPSGVTVYVPAHEAPTLDLADRLKELRDALGKAGRGVPIVIAPVYNFAAGDAKRRRDAASWQAFVAQRADPWLQLAEPIQHDPNEQKPTQQKPGGDDE